MTRSSGSRPEDLLARLASSPRGSGTPELAQARAVCAGELRALGFAVTERTFGYSALPGRVGTPLVGAAAAALVGIAAHVAAAGARWSPLLILAVGGLALAAAGSWLARGAVLTAPVLRHRGVNLECTREARGPGGPAPRVWLCAHLDSKSQPVPTLVRSVGLITQGAGLAGALALAIARFAGLAPLHGLWALVALLTLAGAIPVVLSTVGNRSRGAFDNASGVATVIAAAAELPEPEVGVLITDAEELGLAGARAWVAERGRGSAVVLNCDGVDDGGAVTVMHSGRAPRSLLTAIARASATTGVAHRPMRMFPGILTDSVAFTDAGLDSVTFSRGSLRSLLRVHSRRDTMEQLRGTGIAPTARLMAASARALLTTS